MFKVKKYLPTSLFGRSLIILVMPLVLVQLITSFVFLDNHWSRMASRLSFAVAGEISTLVEDVEVGQSFARLERQAEARLDFDVAFEKGADLYSIVVPETSWFWDYAVADTFLSELNEHLDQDYVVVFDFDRKKVDVYVQLTKGVLRVRLPQRRLFSSSGYIVLLWMFGASALVLLIAVIFMRNQIRPIRKLAIAAERFGKGGDVVAFKTGGAQEVRQAAESFLEMRKRISRQVEQRTAMLAGVSHDLRTPLTRLKLQVEMMKESDDSRAMREDILDMERMIGGYLDFARGADGEQASFTNLSELVGKVAEDAQVEIEEGVYLMLKPMAMERCLSNIIKNAKHYGQKVFVSLQKNEKLCEVLIEDDGPGIPEDQYEDVFKPFFRADEARDTEEGHVGLGLSIAMDIVHAHGGKIVLGRDEKLGGLQVRITLPL